jgi:hypothetical protein
MKQTCDFCEKEFDGKHVCWCGECNKKHPICDVCYESEIVSGKVVPIDKLDDPERYT